MTITQIAYSDPFKNIVGFFLSGILWMFHLYLSMLENSLKVLFRDFSGIE